MNRIVIAFVALSGAALFSNPVLGLDLMKDAAGDDQFLVSPIRVPDQPSFKPITLKDLPPFSNDVERKVSKTGKVHTNGLVSTINFEQYKERKLKGEVKIKLKPFATGFKKEVMVRTFWQKGRAPLAITLLGFGQSSGDKNAQTWQADLYRAGCHVVSFDSVVRNNINEATGHGPAGNVVLEAQNVGKLIGALVAQEDKNGVLFRERITSIRLLGTSYGGVLALQCLRLPNARKWVDRVLLVSAPVSFKTAAARLDRFYEEDRTHVSKMKMAKLLGGYTPKGNDPTEKEMSIMRAGIGYAFHGDLALFAESNAKRYIPGLMNSLKQYEQTPKRIAYRKNKLKQIEAYYKRELDRLDQIKATLSKDGYKKLKKQIENNKKTELAKGGRKLDNVGDWSFMNYIDFVARRYWRIRGDKSDNVKLEVLLKGAPNFVQVVIAADDPLNDPKELQALRQVIKSPQLIVIPHGGHLGFNGTQWFQAMVHNFFKAD